MKNEPFRIDRANVESIGKWSQSAASKFRAAWPKQSHANADKHRRLVLHMHYLPHVVFVFSVHRFFCCWDSRINSVMVALR